MNNKLKKCLVVVLCIALTVGSGVTMAYADDGEDANQKEETVYVLAESDGSVQKIIVSDWLKNLTGSQSLYDRSALTDIENLKGDEECKNEGKSGKIWNAEGKDIYYRGSIKKELPINMEISYKLDGKDIEPEELVGKSGEVTIRFDYENNLYEMAKVGGRTEKIYVPFAVLTGMVMDNDVFSNVEVSSGKVINDGERTVVAGMALPGLADNLNVDSSDLELPDYVEVTADVDKFEMTNTVTVADSSIFADLDTGKIGSADELAGALNQLTNAMKQLLNGSSQLYDGLDTLLDKSGQLALGVHELAAGGKSLKAGATTLQNGVQELSGGITGLKDGLTTLDGNSAAITAGAKQVFESMLATADAQLAAAGAALPKLTIENYSQVLEGAAAAAPDAGSAPILALKAQLDSYNQFYLGLLQYTQGVASAKAGAEQLNTGAAQLTKGTKSLYDGVNALNTGIRTLDKNMPALVDGVTELRGGAKKLNNGLKEFDKEGIQKLAGAAGGNIGDLLDRMKATVNASKAYQSFSGISDDMDGQVRFIYRTEALEEK